MLPRTSSRIALSALLLAACGRPPAPGHPPPVNALPIALGGAAPVPKQAACGLRGSTRMWAGQWLFAEASGGPRVVEFTGERVDIEVLGFSRAAHGRTPVIVRNAGFALRGFLDAGDLDLFVRHEVPVLADALAIEAGARVRALEGGPSGAHVEVDASDFAGVSARLDCAALSLQAPTAPTASSGEGQPFHLRAEHVPIFSSPGGAALGVLSARRAGATVGVVAEQGEFARVVYRRGVRILAWMRRADLEPGEGPDCDDCYGPGVRDSTDRCPDDPDPAQDTGCPDAVPPPALITLARETPIYLQPSSEGASVGVGQRGAEVYVHKREGSWARVHAKGWSVVTPSGGGLWMKL